jgi:hypothetical protein
MARSTIVALLVTLTLITNSYCASYVGLTLSFTTEQNLRQGRVKNIRRSGHVMSFPAISHNKTDIAARPKSRSASSSPRASAVPQIAQALLDPLASDFASQLQPSLRPQTIENIAGSVQPRAYASDVASTAAYSSSTPSPPSSPNSSGSVSRPRYYDAPASRSSSQSSPPPPLPQQQQQHQQPPQQQQGFRLPPLMLPSSMDRSRPASEVAQSPSLVLPAMFDRNSY